MQLAKQIRMVVFHKEEKNRKEKRGRFPFNAFEMAV
jgi:hypothetical protein